MSTKKEGLNVDTGRPLMQVVQEAIYQARWIDTFKEAGNMASDEQIAKAVVEAIRLDNTQGEG